MEIDYCRKKILQLDIKLTFFFLKTIYFCSLVIGCVSSRNSSYLSTNDINVLVYTLNNDKQLKYDLTVHYLKQGITRSLSFYLTWNMAPLMDFLMLVLRSSVADNVYLLLISGLLLNSTEVKFGWKRRDRCFY